MSNEYKDHVEDIKAMTKMLIETNGYVCGECARDLGWVWPEGHCATMHSGKCNACGRKRSLSSWNDWLINGKQIEWD